MSDDFLIESKNNNPDIKNIKVISPDKAPLFIYTNVFEELVGLKISSVNLIFNVNSKLLNLNHRFWRIEADNGLFINLLLGDKIISISYGERLLQAQLETKPVGFCNSDLTIEDIFGYLRWGYDFGEYYEW